jgi:hypothetical protein
MSTDTIENISWERYALLRYMELILYWEGRFTSTHFKDAFGIRRTKASSIMKEYQSLLPDNVDYSYAEKCYQLTPSFQPGFINKTVDEYLDLAGSGKLNSQFRLSIDRIPSINTANGLTRPVNPEILRCITSAIRYKNRIHVTYRSLKGGDGDERIIAPHSLIQAENRWHVRAFCERSGKHKDYVLHRFLTTPTLLGLRSSEAEPENDGPWSRHVNLVIKPNPYLNIERQKLVAHDYNMPEDMRIRLSIREPLVMYVALANRITSPHESEKNPFGHQLVIDNWDEVKHLMLHTVNV